VSDVHTVIDLSSEDNPKSWKAALEAEGCEVTIDPCGLGAHEAIAGFLVAHLRETAESYGFLQ